MPSEDLKYLRSRATEERERASAATSRRIRAVHLEFAKRYEEMAHQLAVSEEMESSREAINNSLGLLRATGRMTLLR